MIVLKCRTKFPAESGDRQTERGKLPRLWLRPGFRVTCYSFSLSYFIPNSCFDCFYFAVKERQEINFVLVFLVLAEARHKALLFRSQQRHVPLLFWGV